MAMVKRLREFLDANGVKYEVTPHQVAYTSQEIAAASHISGKAIAKVVMVRRGEALVMTVLPAACKVGMDRLERILDASPITIAREQGIAGAVARPGPRPP